MHLPPPFHVHGTPLNFSLDEHINNNHDVATDLAESVSSAAANDFVHVNQSDLNDENANETEEKQAASTSSRMHMLSEDDAYRMPLLDEVLTEFPQCAVNIDLKDDDYELMSETHKVIVKHSKQSTVAWGNARDATCQLAHRYDPSIPVFFSSKQVFKLHFAYYTGLLPFIPFKERMLDIPLITTHLEQNAFTMLNQRFRDSNPYTLMLIKLAVKTYQFISSRSLLYEHLRQRGINTCFWVLQTEEEFDHAFALGAAGVMTDFPHRLHRYLEKRGQLERVLQQQEETRQKQLNRQ